MSRSRHVVPVATPYRLDLTANVLRRLSTNVVDIFTPDGRYLRALGGVHGTVVVRATQTRPGALAVTLDGDRRDRAWALATVRRMLGVDRDVTYFTRAAARVPWLRALVRRLSGAKPPRYPSLWEACVNAVAFQQVSLLAASAIVRRLIVALGAPLDSDGVPLYVFPSLDRVLGEDDTVLRAAGLSANKAGTLRRVGEAIASGTLDDAVLEQSASADAGAMLRAIKGIGPWTATLILLRGLGRLDVFPMNDTGVARNLAQVADPVPRDIGQVLKALSPQQGMLYYYLLLARLEARGVVR